MKIWYKLKPPKIKKVETAQQRSAVKQILYIAQYRNTVRYDSVNSTKSGKVLGS